MTPDQRETLRQAAEQRVSELRGVLPALTNRWKLDAWEHAVLLKLVEQLLEEIEAKP